MTESEQVLRQHEATMTELGRALPNSGLSAIGEKLELGGWPEDLRHTPMIIDTDIGEDPDDAFAVAVAGRSVPTLRAVVTNNEVRRGERARFARQLLNALGRQDVITAAGVTDRESAGFVVGSLVDETIPGQPTDVLDVVREICHQTAGPVRWVGIGALTNLARVVTVDPDLAAQLRVTQMGGGLSYRRPERAEHNIRLDVAAARTVFDAVADGRLAAPELVSSDVTYTPEIELDRGSALIRTLSVPSAPAWAHLLVDHLDCWISQSQYSCSLQHDVLTLSAALDLPFVDSDFMNIALDEIGRTTAVDPPAGSRVRWSLRARYRPFMTWLGRVLTPQGDDTTPSEPH